MNLTLFLQSSQQVIDAAGNVVGDYHTHANYSTACGVATTKEHSAWDDDNFSKQDKDDSNFRAGFFKPFTSYLGTPSGQFYQYNSVSNVVSPFH